MQKRITEYLMKANSGKRTRRVFLQIAVCLSFVVCMCVFWHLKLTGITLAGDAFCGMKEHTHSEECMSKTLTCTETGNGTGDETHSHTDECYETVVSCGLDEHIHVESCYSNISADVETEEDWEMSFADVERGTTTAENVVLVAQSQLGYTESVENFKVDADGIRHGITRYGQWYGNPYGTWSSMFVSFCLHYAGVDEVPINGGVDAMRLEWISDGLYKDATEYTAVVGNLLFLDKKDDGITQADSVAIITKVEGNGVTVIEGDFGDAVQEHTYSINDPKIIGYGLVPEVSGFVPFVTPPENTSAIANTTSFNTGMLSGDNQFVFYVKNGDKTYAIDGTGNAVEIYVGDDGRIYTDLDDPRSLYWTVSTYNNNSYAIQNVGTGRYLHPFYNSGSDNGIITPGRWGTTITASGGNAVFSHSAYVRYDSANQKFIMTRTQSQNTTFSVGVNSMCTVWFDGTNGGIMSLGGSDNSSFAVESGGTLTLPTEWKSPDKYNYVIKGWYDLKGKKYYSPGDTVTITESTVFYADWKAASYDVGQFNSFVAPDSVSTNSFVTVNMFDYGALFNLMSESVTVNVDASGHSETWTLLESGNSPFTGEETLDFIFRDWDRGNEDISYPSGHNDKNNPTAAGTVYPGLYTDDLATLLFDPSLQVIGKEYLGTGDFLFQLCEDPSHDHYGYYYYNSERNAASYNQSEQRFYVYEYLECTRDSLNSDQGKYSDFLPLNSPYANTNGQIVSTYNYGGIEGEYNGTTHYLYDSKYSDSNNTTDHVGTNYWFGMSVNVEFYLPSVPGTVIGDGYGNQDIYGKDMHFRFTGDDDVWIFVDGKMVLDLGGLHGRESGDINFSTGEVTINGVRHEEFSNTLKTITSGEHVLTLYYLERGSSLSNCAIYFNLAPRFDFSIRKEDVLTQDVLNGAQFSVYTDKECTIPAELWVSKESHDRDAPATNVFTVTNGVANMWGMGAGNTYYIKETKPPDDPRYGFPNGLIRLTFDKDGTASYNVDIVDDGLGVSPGFIVHGFRIDAETQQAYIVATNAPSWVEETTSVEVLKKWNDTLDHTSGSVTVYLTIKDPDGTVRRLQEATLNSSNNWMAKWDNLPKYAEDGVTLIQYGVEEMYTTGYHSVVEKATGQFEINTLAWRDTTNLQNGKEYILKNSSGLALSTTQSAEDTGFMWVSVDVAQNSPLALWTASVSGSTVRFTNKAGQTLTFYYGNGRPTDLYAYKGHVEDNNRKQYLTYTTSANGITLRYSNYYIASTMNSSNKFENATQQNRALVLMPSTLSGTTSTIPIENEGFIVTNTPIDKETSVVVYKKWSLPDDLDESIYERAQVTVRLLANGMDTGRTITLSLRNGWSAEFKGLPYADINGNTISYTVKEEWLTDDWVVSYSDITVHDGTVPTYSVTVTNTYRTGGPILPSTGSPVRQIYILCGATIMAVPLIYGFWLRRKRERRRNGSSF